MNLVWEVGCLAAANRRAEELDLLDWAGKQTGVDDRRL